MPQTDMINKVNKQVYHYVIQYKIIRGLTSWEGVLQDVRLKSLDLVELKKWKIAKAYD